MANFAGVSPINSDTLIQLEKIQVTITPASVSAASAVEQTFSVPGFNLRPGDFVDVTPPGITAGVCPTCARVSAINTVAITFINPTAGALTPLAGVYQIQLNR